MTPLSEIERARTRLENQLEPEVADIFAGQGDLILQTVENAHSVLWAQFEAERIAGDDRFAREAIYLVYTSVFPLFAATSYGAIIPPIKAWTDVDDWLQAVLDFLGIEGGEMIRSIAATTLADVKRVLTKGAEEGASVPKMVKALKEEWPGLTSVRAKRIVRTEIIAASNAGSVAGYEQAAVDYGIELEKEWLTTEGSDRHPTYPGLNGQRVPVRGGMFNVGGNPARYPGDPNLPADERINCKCAVVAVPVGSKAVGFLDRRDREIRTSYEPLKAEHGAYGARLELADKHSLSERQIRRILFTGERA